MMAGLRVAALVEALTLVALLVNLATVHWRPVTALGGPLHGTFTQRPDPPDLIPHHVGDHTVLYVRRWNLALTEHTAVFAPVGMDDGAIEEQARGLRPPTH